MKDNLKEYKSEIMILLDKFLKPGNCRKDEEYLEYWLSQDSWKKMLKSCALEFENIISHNLHLHELNNKSNNEIIYPSDQEIIIEYAKDLIIFLITENKSLTEEIII